MRRLVVALLALYALALQGVLGGMVAAAVTAPEHALCLSGEGSPGAAPSEKHLPAHGHLACCTAAHVAMPAATVAPISAAIVPARQASAAPPPYPTRVAAPRGPPGTGPSPRAPPVA